MSAILIAFRSDVKAPVGVLRINHLCKSPNHESEHLLRILFDTDRLKQCELVTAEHAVLENAICCDPCMPVPRPPVSIWGVPLVTAARTVQTVMLFCGYPALLKKLIED